QVVVNCIQEIKESVIHYIGYYHTGDILQIAAFSRFLPALCRGIGRIWMRIYVRTPNGRVPNFPDKYFSELFYSVRRYLTPFLMRKKFLSVKVLGADNIVTRFFFEFVSFSWSLIFKRSQRCAEF